MTKEEALKTYNNNIQALTQLIPKNADEIADKIRLSLYTEILEKYIQLSPDEYNLVKDNLKKSYEEVKLTLMSILNSISKKEKLVISMNQIELINLFLDYMKIKTVNVYRVSKKLEILM